MALFTIILDYRGGTHVRQVRSSSAKKALLKSIKDFDVLNAGAKKQIVLEIQDQKLVRIEGMRDVWCTSAAAGRNLALFHIVATAS